MFARDLATDYTDYTDSEKKTSLFFPIRVIRGYSRLLRKLHVNLTFGGSSMVVNNPE